VLRTGGKSSGWGIGHVKMRHILENNHAKSYGKAHMGCLSTISGLFWSGCKIPCGNCDVDELPELPEFPIGKS
jgi:hypothetical protein